jgi:hypothetical protein
MTVAGTRPAYSPGVLLEEVPMDWYENPVSSIPFPGGVRVLTAPGSAEATDHQVEERGSAWLSSPFSEGLASA